MNNNKKVVAVIVTYNRLSKLKKAISTILAQDVENVVVVNNQSTDGTSEWLDNEAKIDSRLIPLHREDNTGGAGGFFYGLKYVHENSIGDWVLLYDDDAYPGETLIQNFQALDLNDDVGAVTGAVYTPDGVVADFNRPGITPFKSIESFFKYCFSGNGIYLSKEEMKSGSGLQVDFSTFVGFFVRSDIIGKIGYPVKDFFIYCDDWLYSFNVSKLGYKNLYFSDLTFYHDSNTFVQDYDDQLWKKYYALRNAVYLYKQVCGLFFPIVFAIKFIKWTIDAKNYKSKGTYFKTLWKACFDGIRFKNLNQPIESI